MHIMYLNRRLTYCEPRISQDAFPLDGETHFFICLVKI